MSNLIVLEGPDKVGKTTVAEKLQKALGLFGHRALYLKQPNPLGPLGASSARLKSTTSELNPTTRAALFGLTEMYDAGVILPEALSKNDFVIMDRSFLSGWVYSKAFPTEICAEETYKMLSQAHKNAVNSLVGVQVYVIFILNPLPFCVPDDKEFYEGDENWHAILKTYHVLRLRLEDDHAFKLEENVVALVNLASNHTVQYLTDLVTANHRLFIPDDHLIPTKRSIEILETPDTDETPDADKIDLENQEDSNAT